MTTDRTSSPVSSHARGLQRRKPAPLALEARIMFDGAAVATAAEAVKPAAAEAPVAHVAELGSVVAASQAESRSTAPADTSKAADTSKNAPETAKPAATERATDGLASSATKVLFVDSRVPDYQAIVAAAAADVKVVILDADHDGVQQIADALEGMHNVASISIVSHGDSGLLLLGNTALHAGDMAQYQAELGKIGSAMQAGGEILLYGCDVGAGSNGESFIHSLADATGAVVAASTDSTGDVAHGGNWDLEIATGALTSAPVLDVAKLADYDYTLETTSVSTLAQLKTALATAATDNLDDVITLTANITFTSASDTIIYAATDAHKTTIVGGGHTISGANLTQVLHINSGSGSVELSNLTITNGLVSGNGGDSLSTGGTAGSDALGGGIYNAGTLTITNSIITANKAAGGGGGGGSGPNDRTGSGGAGGGGGGYGQGIGGTGGNLHPGAIGVVITASGKAGTAGSGGNGGYNPDPTYLAYAGKGGSSGAGAAGGGIGGQLYTPGDSGGNGGVASNGTISISGGGGGGSYVKAGGKGGNAAGGIYNAGLLTIVSSTVSNNIAAGGGGGGGTVSRNSAAATGVGGDGGNAAGGIYNIGTLRLDTTSTSNMTGNVGRGGAGGKGNPANGLNGNNSDDRTTTGTVDTSYVTPTLSGATAGQTVNDNTTLSPFVGITLTGSNLSMTITLDSAAKGSFTSTSLSANGFSTADGGLTYTHAATTAAALQTAVNALVYQATPNRVAVGSTETTTFTVAISDGGGSVSNNTTTVVATSVNDAPTGLGNTSIPSILEDAASPSGVAISALTGLSFADPDVSSSLGGIAVTGNTANSGTQGAWQYSADAGAHWYAVGAVSDTSALVLSASSLLRFVPVADYNGTPPTLTVRAVDNTRSGYTTSAATEQRITAVTSTNGGITAFAASTNTISTSVTAVNDAPVFTKGGNQTVLEDAGAQTVSGWATGINAGAANESGQTLNFIVSNNNNALFSSQPSIDASGNLTFTPAANANGTATVTLSLHDNGGTANGGVDTSATQTFTITVTAVNDAPTGVGNLTLPTVLEDTTSPAGVAINALTGLAFADVDTGDTLGGLAIVANTADSATQGVWQYSTNGSNWYAIGTVSDSTALTVSATTQLRFVPVANYNGTPPGLTVRAVDSSYAGVYSVAVATETRSTVDVTSIHGGTTAISDNTNTVGITVTAVNDAPTFTKGADVTVLEDAGAQTINNWASNLSPGPANESSQTLSVITTNSNNALFSVQPSVDTSGKLSFTGAANANGTATITVKLQDNGGTTNGGVDSSTQTFTITITAVNDAPTGSPTVSGSNTEGQVLTASTSSIADVDGLVGVTYNHQWQVSTDGTTAWADISGATASTYTLDSAQVGKFVRDKVSFTDNGGTLETLFSAATSSSIAGVVPQVSSINRAGAAAVSGSATSVVYNVTFNVAVNGVDASDFTLTAIGTAAGTIASVTGSGATYQVTVNGLSGDGILRLDLNNSGTGIASGSSTPIGGGFTSGQTYTLDHTPPSVTAVSIPNSPLKVGDTQTVTINVSDDGGTPYSLVSGTVGGYSLSNLVRTSSTSYTVQFTVTSPGTDIAAGSDVPVSLVLSDAAGNHNTAFTTPISQSNDSISGNAPTLLNLSNASVQTTAGLNAVVGVLSTTDASVGDTFTYTIVSGTGDTDNAAFSLVGNSLRVNDPVALGNGTYSVRLRTTDSGGNSIEQAFTITVSSYSAPVAVADTASATEAGGVANATAGVNPVGNVLANDQSSNTKTITAIAGGTIGTARAGTYGSLTLNADGTYTYTVNNSNAAVQALRTNADTLTDTFTYTMADNTAATSSATLTVTIHGANDAPRVATAITAQQVTVSTPLLYVVPVGTFADVDAGDTLTYTATLNGGAPLPAWLTFNAATRTFSGTPTTVENLSIVVTATDLSAASASSIFTLQVAAAAPSGGGGGTPTTPTTPTDPGTPTTPVTPPTTPVTPTDPVTPVTPVTPPVTPVTPDVPVVTTPVQVPDPQVPNNPQPVQPITAVQQTPLQSISESVVETVTQPQWSANQMISESATSIRVAAPPVAPVNGFTSTAFVGTGSSFVSASGGFSPVNEHYSPLSPTPFNDFQRTLTDSGPGIFPVAISPLGQTGLVVLSGIQDQQFTAGDHLSFTVPSDAFGHSDAQPGIVLRASQADGRALPSWLTFNSTTGQFEGTPPPGFRGELVIKVVAKDSSGHQAEVTFRVKAHTGQTSADIPRGRSGLSEQLRTAANRTTAWVSGRI